MVVETQKCFSFCAINATKFGTKTEISHKIIMQWKKSYYIATNVSRRKSAITFGDLPDCLTYGDPIHWGIKASPDLIEWNLYWYLRNCTTWILVTYAIC